jgi:hypothetical protein
MHRINQARAGIGFQFFQSELTALLPQHPGWVAVRPFRGVHASHSVDICRRSAVTTGRYLKYLHEANV